MSFLVFAIRKDLCQLGRSPLVLLVWAGIPFAIGAMITLMTGGGHLPKVHLLVADEDESLVSQVLVGALSSGPARDMIQLESLRREVGEARIRQGDGTALLLIPAGFGAAALGEAPTELTLLTNPAQQILPDLAGQGIQVLVDGAFYLHRILGDELSQVAAGDTSVVALAQMTATLLRLMQHLEPYLVPPIISVNSVVINQAEIPITFAFMMLPGMLMMALLFAAQGLSTAYWKDRDNGTLRRLALTPTSVNLWFVGKIVSAAVVMALICAALLGVGMAYHGLSFTRFPLALIWLVWGGIVFYLGLSLLQMYAPNQRVGTFLTQLITLPLLMVGGSFFPMDTMPDWMATLGGWTPNGYMLNHLQVIVLGQAGFVSTSMALLGVMALAGALFGLCCRRNRRVAVLG